MRTFLRSLAITAILWIPIIVIVTLVYGIGVWSDGK